MFCRLGSKTGAVGASIWVPLPACYKGFNVKKATKNLLQKGRFGGVKDTNMIPNGALLHHNVKGTCGDKERYCKLCVFFELKMLSAATTHNYQNNP